VWFLRNVPLPNTTVSNDGVDNDSGSINGEFKGNGEQWQPNDTAEFLKTEGVEQQDLWPSAHALDIPGGTDHQEIIETANYKISGYIKDDIIDDLSSNCLKDDNHPNLPCTAEQSLWPVTTYTGKGTGKGKGKISKGKITQGKSSTSSFGSFGSFDDTSSDEEDTGSLTWQKLALKKELKILGRRLKLCQAQHDQLCNDNGFDNRSDNNTSSSLSSALTFSTFIDWQGSQPSTATGISQASEVPTGPPGLDRKRRSKARKTQFGKALASTGQDYSSSAGFDATALSGGNFDFSSAALPAHPTAMTTATASAGTQHAQMHDL